MAKRTHAQVQAEPAVAVRKLKKPVKKQAKPSDPDAPTGPRRAKVAALNNAVWKSLAPKPQCKRVATTPANPSSKRAYKKRKTSLKTTIETEPASDDDAISEGDGVSIPPPAAPMKPQRYAKIQSAGQKVAMVRQTVLNDPFIDDLEVESESESLTGSCALDEQSDEGLEDGGSEMDDSEDDEANPEPTAAEKRFAGEQVIWSVEENVQQDALASFVIHGGHIEISSDSDDDGQDDSPTVHLAPATSQAVKTEPLTSDVKKPPQLVVKKEPLHTSNVEKSMPRGTVHTRTEGRQGQRNRENKVPHATQLRNAPAVPSHPTWPDYTTLQPGPKANELGLTAQMFELQNTIRNAMELIAGRVRFKNAYPSLSERSKWNHECLLKASTSEEKKAQGERKVMYAKIRERIIVDREYFDAISTILNPRLSLLRGLTKTYAVINARAFYGLHNGCTQLVQDLLRKKQYIYPPSPNGQGYLRDKPFEHNAIVGTLHDDLFGGNYSIVKQYPQHFKEGMETRFALRASMVALAATAIFAAIKEWDSGVHRSAPFLANIYDDTYAGHIKDLEHIEKTNKPAYDSMMRRLFRLASFPGSTTADNENIIDIQNMAVDDVVANDVDI